MFFRKCTILKHGVTFQPGGIPEGAWSHDKFDGVDGSYGGRLRGATAGVNATTKLLVTNLDYNVSDSDIKVRKNPKEEVGVAILLAYTEICDTRFNTVQKYKGMYILMMSDDDQMVPIKLYDSIKSAVLVHRGVARFV